MCKSLPNIEYTSIDVVSGRAMMQMDVTNLNFEKDTFDSIICYHVLDDVKDDLLVMQEMFRVLKPRGWAVIQVPIDVNRAATLEDVSVPEHNDVRIYGLDFKNRLKNAGFEVRVEQYVNEMNSETIKKYGLKDRYYTRFYTTCEDIYFCMKKR